MLQRRSPLRRILVLVSLAASAMLAAGGGVLWRRSHIPGFFDNALAVPVTITVDGAAFPVAADARVERSLAAGTHTVTVDGPKGEIERSSVKIPTPLLLEAFEDPGFFVYNVSELRVYEREVIGYTAKKNEHQQTYDRDVIGMQRFFGQSKVDFLFREAPRKIHGDDLAEVEQKTAFNTVPGGLVDYAAFRVTQDDLAGAEKALRRSIALEPCGDSATEALVPLLFLQKRTEEALAVARARTDCLGIEPHRSYQDALELAGRAAEARAAYKARLDAHPEVGANHYLYGRTLEDHDRQLAEFRAALRLDPGLARAHAAIGYVFLELERPAEALEALGRAVAIPGHPTDFYRTYAMAAVGAGALEPADRALQGAGGLAVDLWQARWLLALAGGRFDDAQDLLNAHEDDDPGDPDLWKHRILLLRLAGRREALDRELGRASLREDLASDLAAVRLDLALEEKRFHDAVVVVDQEMAKDGTGAGPLDRLYGAAAQLLAGDRKAAGERLARLAGDLSEGVQQDDLSQEARTAALLLEVLRRPVPADEAVRGAARLDFRTIPHAYFMLGVRAASAGDGKAARAFFEKSSKTALGLELPYLAARALAATR